MPQDAEDRLRETLRKIEALYAGAATAGEKSAAGAAAERIRQQLKAATRQERAEEFKFSIPDPWSRQLFIALCRRYGLKPFRYTRMHQQTVLIRAPAGFVQGTLWPEFEALSQAHRPPPGNHPHDHPGRGARGDPGCGRGRRATALALRTYLARR